MRVNALAILILLSCAAPTAFAQATASSSDDATTVAPTQQQRQPLDANHDGYISRDEAQSRPAIARNFDKIDTNHDGKIDRQEFQSWRQQMQSRRSQNGQGGANGEPQSASSGG